MSRKIDKFYTKPQQLLLVAIVKVVLIVRLRVAVSLIP